MTPPIDRRYLYRLTWLTRWTTVKRLDIEEESIERKRRKHQRNPDQFDDPDKEPEMNESEEPLNIIFSIQIF